MTPIKDTFFAALPPTGRVLDIGAGNAPHARMLHEKGYRVVATDKNPRPDDLPSDIEWLTFDLNGELPPLAPEDFDGILIRNVIQFLEKDRFVNVILPWMMNALKSGGVLAIETFWDRMDYVAGYDGPREDRTPHPSYYPAEELRGLLDGMEILWTDQFRHDLPDMQGRPMNFAIAQIVARKR